MNKEAVILTSTPSAPKAVSHDWPRIIQGGMGAGVSNWRLARAVAMAGQLGVVSGTALDVILARRLQDGDPGGDMRRALEHFPIPEITERILHSHFNPGGRKPGEPYKRHVMHTVPGSRKMNELCMAANFVEVYLAKEGHDGPIGINFLEKISFPHLPSAFGAMLAGVDVVLMGAGIPKEIPRILDELSLHQATTYPVIGGGETATVFEAKFDPNFFTGGNLAPLKRPNFLPIVSAHVLAQAMLKWCGDGIHGFIIEGPTAGGHNAPPRGPMKLDAAGEPIYGDRDRPNLEVFRKLGLPFWMAGSYGRPELYRAARAEGAAGVQVGTAFALCDESGLADEIKAEAIHRAMTGTLKTFTDARASSTGYPFKVVLLPGTASEEDVYRKRIRICDLGYLREAAVLGNGPRIYRCSAEPEEDYLAKGGKIEDTIGRKCLCNALMSNIGLGQIGVDGTLEPTLVTAGDDFSMINLLCTEENPHYSAANVLGYILGK